MRFDRDIGAREITVSGVPTGVRRNGRTVVWKVHAGDGLCHATFRDDCRPGAVERTFARTELGELYLAMQAFLDRRWTPPEMHTKDGNA